MMDGPKSDAEWRAEQDAETIAEAKLIMSDKNRFANAQAAAEKRAKELKERAAKMDSVAGSKTLRPDGAGDRNGSGGTSSKGRVAIRSTTLPADIPLTILKKAPK